VKEIATTVRKLYDEARKAVTVTATAGAAPKRKKWLAKYGLRRVLTRIVESRRMPYVHVFAMFSLTGRLADVYPTITMFSHSLDSLEALLTDVPSDKLSTAAFTSTV
jgi:hypothetical protein